MADGTAIGRSRAHTSKRLRTGFTTGACATAASIAAAKALLEDMRSDTVTIDLPRGGNATFDVESLREAETWAEAGVRKDAGDDPDVTHGCLVLARIALAKPPNGITFHAGPGVGTVTRYGLPIPPGEPAINPVPRKMIDEALRTICSEAGISSDLTVTISIPDGEVLAEKTWNPRLGIVGGLSILGTTGIVRPFSCAAWIASIHRGIDVARAAGAEHVVGSTGSTTERAAQERFGLPSWAMLDMGDFVGGMLKYLRVHPVPRVTIAGGFGKMVKLAHGSLDLHSKRSQVDFLALAEMAEPVADPERIAACNTAAEALSIAGPNLAAKVAEAALSTARKALKNDGIKLDTLIVDRSGQIVASAGMFGSEYR